MLWRKKPKKLHTSSIAHYKVFIIIAVIGCIFLFSCYQACKIRYEYTKVAVYLGHTNQDVCICNSPVERKIKRTKNAANAARLALEELIKGPTEEERANGYRMCLPAGGQIARYEEFYSAMMEESRQTGGGISQFGKKFLNSEGKFTPWGDRIKVRSVRIEDWTAYADFSKELYSYGGGSCSTEAIETSIVNTLKQFPEVEKVVILVEGREAQIEP
jgi:hypothetical protein